MQSLKRIRRRIQSVRNTQKVTRAMKLVAAAKLRRAQREATSARAYSEALRSIVQRISSRAGSKAPPLMRRRKEIKNLDVLLLTSDRGLCGGFNENLILSLLDGVDKQVASGIDVAVFVYGRKGWQYLKNRRPKTLWVTKQENENMPDLAGRIASMFADRFLSEKSDGATIAFNRFGSAARQEISFWDILPLHRRGVSKDRLLDYIYEPVKEDIHDEISRHMISRSIEQAMLESFAAELSARMMAMDNATKNADEMIEHLTLAYHKARQSAITAELLDIVGGAEALR